MRFEIINPSDPYTMEADDLEVAAVAVCLLGNGKYGLSRIGGDRGTEVPPFLFGGHDEWFTDKFGADFERTAERVLNQRGDALARAFESVTLERAERSSMNNIGGKAQELGRVVRKSMQDAEARG